LQLHRRSSPNRALQSLAASCDCAMAVAAGLRKLAAMQQWQSPEAADKYRRGCVTAAVARSPVREPRTRERRGQELEAATEDTAAAPARMRELAMEQARDMVAPARAGDTADHRATAAVPTVEAGPAEDAVQPAALAQAVRAVDARTAVSGAAGEVARQPARAVAVAAAGQAEADSIATGTGANTFTCTQAAGLRLRRSALPWGLLHAASATRVPLAPNMPESQVHRHNPRQGHRRNGQRPSRYGRSLRALHEVRDQASDDHEQYEAGNEPPCMQAEINVHNRSLANCDCQQSLLSEFSQYTVSAIVSSGAGRQLRCTINLRQY